MNLKLLSSVALLTGMAVSPAFASTGTISFTGSISNVTCSVSGGTPGTNKPDFDVDIGAVSAGDFTAPGVVSGITGFRIYIGKAGETSCTDDTKVWATFEPGANVDPTTGALITTGGATGVQIRLFDKNGKAIDILGNDQNNGPKETIANHQATLVYAAGYEAVDSVTAGKADSSVVYTVRYES